MNDSTLARFFAKVEYVGDCWIWTGAKANGYGRLFVGSKRDGTNRIVSAHRLAYQHFVGPIPLPQLDHLCRERA